MSEAIELIEEETVELSKKKAEEGATQEPAKEESKAEEPKVEETAKAEPEPTPEPTPEPAPAAIGPVVKLVKNQELQDFVDRFGLELGFKYYQEGATFESAFAEAFDSLKEENASLRAKIAALESDLELANKRAEPVKEEPTGLTASYATEFARRLETLEKRVDASALVARRGDTVGLSESVDNGAGKPTYYSAFIDSFNK